MIVSGLMLITLVALAAKAFIYVVLRGRTIPYPRVWGWPDVIRSLLEFAVAGIIAGRLWGAW